MHKAQPTPTGMRRWLQQLPGAPRSGAPMRRPASRPVPFAGARGRPATTSGRFGGLRSGGRRSARRGKQSSRNSAMALARGLFGARGKNKTSSSARRSRRGPALLAALGGLGAAGAAAFKRRQSARNEALPEGGTQTPPAPAA